MKCFAFSKQVFKSIKLIYRAINSTGSSQWFWLSITLGKLCKNKGFLKAIFSQKGTQS